MEGLAAFIGRGCIEEFGQLPKLFKQFDYSNVGGAPLLGVNGVSIVCHGSSKREAVLNGLIMARNCVVKKMIAGQKLALESVI